MGIPIKLQVFEGPLDLLLHLIDKNKVNIYDIPIVEITHQYLEYIQEMEHRELGVMSEFLVMAATLLDIKARMLLPKEINEDGEEEDPRQELVEQLLQYKLFKYMSYELRDRLEEAEKAWYRDPKIPEEVNAYKEPINLDELIGDLTLSKLQSIFKSIIKKQADKIDPIRSKFSQIEMEEVSITDKLDQIRDYLQFHQRCSFRNLLENQKGKMQIIVTFLAILELMKMGEIKIMQKEIFDDIEINAALPAGSEGL